MGLIMQVHTPELQGSYHLCIAIISYLKPFQRLGIQEELDQ